MSLSFTTRVLWVDFNEEKVTTKEFNAETVRKYIGGTGLATKVVWEQTAASTDPFSSENPLIFMTGPITGTIVPSSSRFIVAGLSPLTNIWGEAHCGGTWADELRHTGFDGIIFTGKARKPVYLLVRDQAAKLVDAGHLWGKETFETDALLKEEVDSRASIATIGPAGERLARIACIISDGKHGRAAAKCGLGALMGSKNLKAIVVRGTEHPRIYNMEGLKKKVAEHCPNLPPVNAATRDRIGRMMQGSVRDNGRTPIKNYLEGDFKSFFPMVMEMTVAGEPYYCRRCRTSCIDSKMEGGVRHPVWHALAPLGSGCLIDDREALIEAFNLIQRYGLDGDSTGNVIALAMEAYEKGLISAADTGGVELRWGNAKAMVEMVRQIGLREGFGAILGEGVRRAAKHIGGTASEYAMHVKGMEIPGHDPRASNPLAMDYATSNMGASHLSGSGIFFPHSIPNKLDMPKVEGRFSVDGVAGLVAKMQNYTCLIDSIVCCKFLCTAVVNYIETRSGVQPDQLLDFLNCVTGWDMELPEFLLCGERIFNLQRMINVRRGISRKDDTLPPRLLTHSLKQGGTQGNLPPLGRMLGEYYKVRGWSEEGLPTSKKIVELGLAD